MCVREKTKEREKGRMTCPPAPSFPPCRKACLSAGRCHALGSAPLTNGSVAAATRAPTPQRSPYKGVGGGATYCIRPGPLMLCEYLQQAQTIVISHSVCIIIIIHYYFIIIYFPSIFVLHRQRRCQKVCLVSDCVA